MFGRIEKEFFSTFHVWSSAYMNIFSVYPKPHSPSLSVFRYSTCTTPLAHSPIEIAFVIINDTKVIIGIVKSIVIDVVRYLFIPLGQSEDMAVHPKKFRFSVWSNCSSTCVVTSSVIVPIGAPVILREFFKSMCRYACDLTLGERYFAVGLILGCHARSSEAGRIRPVLKHLTPPLYQGVC